MIRKTLRRWWWWWRFGAQTCPVRGSWRDAIQQASEEGKDYWILRRGVGPDRICSFCTSLHPDDFRDICIDILAGTGRSYTYLIIPQNNKTVFVHRTWMTGPPATFHQDHGGPRLAGLMMRALEASLAIASQHRQEQAHNLMRSTRTRFANR